MMSAGKIAGASSAWKLVVLSTATDWNGPYHSQSEKGMPNRDKEAHRQALEVCHAKRRVSDPDDRLPARDLKQEAIS